MLKVLKYTVLLFLACVSVAAADKAKKPQKIKPVRTVSIKVKEPSDICLSPSGNSFYIVSDDGLLYETDLDGKILRKAAETGYDFEGVHSDANFVYVVDEMTRKVHLYSHRELKLEKTVKVPYSGGRNQSYESITRNETKKCLILITEYNPTWIFELDENFNVINEVKFKSTRDISAATWYNGYLWFLSDEDRMVMKVDPQSYRVEASWQVPVINPEGISFTKEGQLVIVSDDLEKLFYFNNPDNAKK